MVQAQARRAIVCFVEEVGALIEQALALRESWLYVQSPDTDLVVMGPAAALRHFPADVVKLEQRPVADDAEWFNYRYANGIACLNGAAATELDRYTHILHTDVDTFITPAWNDFHPTRFHCGTGGYAHDDDVKARIRLIATELGLTHRGLTNTGSTWYGPTQQVRRVGALTDMLTRYILSRHFLLDEGQWPHWYRGVSGMYAAEIALNHCVPDITRSDLLDHGSASQGSVSDCVHIRCWHSDAKFSKFRFQERGYSAEDMTTQDLGIVRNYSMEMAVRSLRRLDAPGSGS